MPKLHSIDKRETFDEVIQSKEPIIMKFYADWCPDCKRLDVFIGSLIDEFSDTSWYEVNSDELLGLAEIYGIMGIPCILIFKSGEKIAHLSSAHAKTPEDIRAFLIKEL